MDDLRLSTKQEQAVASRARAITVVASAGTGKTEVVARRVERILVESEREEFRVLAVSYTIRAADGLSRRLATRLGALHRRVDADTIHGFALGCLRQHGTRIGLPLEPEVLTRLEDRHELLSEWLKREGRRPLDDPAETFSKLDLDRTRGITDLKVDSWRQVLAEAGAVDYPAMLERATELMQLPSVHRIYRALYRHVVVDEAQNLTRAQYRLLTELIGRPSADHIPAVMIGDERQSIVGFAGADHTLMAEFETEYEAERIELDTNYRSAVRIAEAAEAVANALGQPPEPLLVRFPAEGEVRIGEYPTEEAEGEAVADWVRRQLAEGLAGCVVAPGEPTSVDLEQVAVLGRSAAALNPTREALDKLDIAHASASTPDEWVTSPAGQALVEMIGLRSAPDHLSIRRRLAQLCGHPDPEAWSNVAELCAGSSDPGIVELTQICVVDSPEQLISELDRLEIEDQDWPDDARQIKDAWASFVDRAAAGSRSFAEFKQHIARCQRGDRLDPGVRLLTIHKAQGQEFKSVALVACNQGQIPDFRSTTADEIAAELRTFYVAVSRPTRSLLLTRSETRLTRYSLRDTEQSDFLSLVEPAASLISA